MLNGQFYNAAVRADAPDSAFTSAFQHSEIEIAPAPKAPALPHRDPEKPAAHVSDCLALLPSGPDAVRRLKLHRFRAAVRRAGPSAARSRCGFSQCTLQPKRRQAPYRRLLLRFLLTKTIVIKRTPPAARLSPQLGLRAGQHR